MKSKLALLSLILGLVAGIPALAQSPKFSNNVGGSYFASEYGQVGNHHLTPITVGADQSKLKYLQATVVETRRFH